MRFHHATTFLPVDQALGIAKICDGLGYSGVFVSDHLFNPRDLESKYTYSTNPDGSPFWEKETAWPDPMCLISAMAAVTSNVLFTTGIYIAPVRDLITVAKTVGAAAVISDDRVRLGVGVGWCKEEFDLTGQDFSTRGKRLDDMIPALRALWSGGWVEYHGPHYDVPPCQMNPSPTKPVPILGGGDSAPAIRRAATLCDGWISTGAVPVDVALQQAETITAAVRAEGRSLEDYTIYAAVGIVPDVDEFKRLEEAGITDLLCGPGMFLQIPEGADSATQLELRRVACERFAEEILAHF